MGIAVNTVHARCDTVLSCLLVWFFLSCILYWRHVLCVLLELSMIYAQRLALSVEKLHDIERCVVSVAGRTLLNSSIKLRLAYGPLALLLDLKIFALRLVNVSS
jgi:hypothetical protein